MDASAEKGKKVRKWGSRKHKKTDSEKQALAQHVDEALNGASAQDNWKAGKSSGPPFAEPPTKGNASTGTTPQRPLLKLPAEPVRLSTAVPVASMEQANLTTSIPSHSPPPASTTSSPPLTNAFNSSREFPQLPPLVRSEEAELRDPPSRHHRGRRLFGKLTRSLSKNRSLPPSPNRMSASSQGSENPKGFFGSKSERSSSQPPSPERASSHRHRRWWFSRSGSQAKSQPTTPDKQGADVSKSLDQARGRQSAEPTSPVSWLATSTDSWGGSTEGHTPEGGESGGLSRSQGGVNLAARGPGPWSAPTTPQGKGASQWSVPSTPKGVGSPPSSGPSTPSASRGPQWVSLGSPPVVEVTDWSLSSAVAGSEGLQAESPTTVKAPGWGVPRYGEAGESPGGSDWNGSTGGGWQSASNSLASSPRGWREEGAGIEGVTSVPGIQTAPSLDAGFGGDVLGFEDPPAEDTSSKEAVSGEGSFEEPGDPSPISVLSQAARPNQEQLPLSFSEGTLATVEEAPVAEAVEAFDFAPHVRGPINIPPGTKGDGREKGPRALFPKEDALVSDPGVSEPGAEGKEGASFEGSGLRSERPGDNGEGHRKLEVVDSEPSMKEEGANDDGLGVSAEQPAGPLLSEGGLSSELGEREAVTSREGVLAVDGTEHGGSEHFEAASRTPHVSAGIVDLVSYFESEAFKKTDISYPTQKGTLNQTGTADLGLAEAVSGTAPSLVPAEPVFTVPTKPVASVWGGEATAGKGGADEARSGQLASGSLPEKTDGLGGIGTAFSKGPLALEKLLASSHGASAVAANASEQVGVSESTEERGAAPEITVKWNAVTEPTEERSTAPEPTEERSAVAEPTEERSAATEGTEERSAATEPTEERNAAPKAAEELGGMPGLTGGWGGARTDRDSALGGYQGDSGEEVRMEEGLEDKEGGNDRVNESEKRADVEDPTGSAKNKYEQNGENGTTEEPAKSEAHVTGKSSQESARTQEIKSAPEHGSPEEFTNTDEKRSSAEPHSDAIPAATAEKVESGVDASHVATPDQNHVAAVDEAHVAVSEGSDLKQNAEAPLQDSQQGQIEEPEDDVESDASTGRLTDPADVTDDGSSGAEQVREQAEADVSSGDQEKGTWIAESDPAEPRQHDVIQVRPQPPAPHPAVQILLVSGILAKAVVKTSVGLTYITAKQCGVLAKVTTNGVIDDVKGVAGSLLGFAGRMVGLGKSAQ